nr:unnamed protein product [Callosobruchus chinensis]
MSSENDDTNCFFKTITLCNKLAGVWLEPKTSKKSKRMLFIIWDTTLLVLAIMFFMCEVLMVKHILSELKKLFKHLAMLATHTVGILKFLLIITHQKELAKIRSMLQNGNLVYNCCINLPKAARSFSNKICLTTYFLYIMVGTSAHLSAIRNLNAAIQENQFGGNVTCYDFLPYLFVIPFDSESTNGCKNALMTMDIGLCIFAGYIACKTKLDILTEATRNVRRRTIQKLNMPKNFEAIRDDGFPELEIKLHSELKTACRGIENVFSYTILAQTIMSLLVIASCMFAASLMTYTDPEFYSLVEYAIAAVFQLLMVCHFGNSIIVAGETYRYSLYEVDWYSSSKRFKQCLLIMMYRMERPLYLTIGKFSPLTLQTFVASENFFRTIEFFNKVCGVWLEKGGSSAKKVAHILWDAFLLLLALLFFLCEVIMMRYTIGELKQLIRHIGMLATHIAGFLKFAVLILNQSRIAELKTVLQDKQYYYEKCGDFNPGKIASKSKRFCHRYTIVTYFLYSMVGGSAHISALWHLNSDQKGEYFTTNATCYDFMPYLFIIPFNTETTNGCKNAFIVMDVALGIMASYIASYDALFCSLLICLKTKLQILCEATKAIRERVVMRLEFPDNYRLFKDDLNPELEAEMLNFSILLSNVIEIELHIFYLFSVCIDIEALFSYTTLIQTMTSLVVLASCLFVATLVPYTDPEFYSLVEYSLAILCQLLMICYFGNLITEVSLSYRYSLYECEWYSSSHRFKQAILIMMCRLEKPLYLTIGKFSPLTLNTFVSLFIVKYPSKLAHDSIFATAE